MSKKLALVLGGNGGIGSSAVRRLIEDGMHVCTTYYKNKDQIEKIKADLKTCRFTEYKCNTLVSTDVNKVVNDITSSLGHIDVVVFALAPELKYKKLLSLEWDDYKEHFDVQLKSIHYTIKALTDQIQAKHETKFIVLLTEACVGTPPKGLSHYLTAKYAALGMAKAMAVELAPYGCTVNMISPGMVETPLLTHLPSKLVEMTAYQNPMKRNAIPNDVSNAISYLASDQSDYLNGTNIVINGGGKIN